MRVSFHLPGSYNGSWCYYDNRINILPDSILICFFSCKKIHHKWKQKWEALNIDNSQHLKSTCNALVSQIRKYKNMLTCFAWFCDFIISSGFLIALASLRQLASLLLIFYLEFSFIPSMAMPEFSLRGLIKAKISENIVTICKMENIPSAYLHKEKKKAHSP